MSNANSLFMVLLQWLLLERVQRYVFHFQGEIFNCLILILIATAISTVNSRMLITFLYISLYDYNLNQSEMVDISI